MQSRIDAHALGHPNMRTLGGLSDGSRDDISDGSRCSRMPVIALTRPYQCRLLSAVSVMSRATVFYGARNGISDCSRDGIHPSVYGQKKATASLWSIRQVSHRMDYSSSSRTRVLLVCQSWHMRSYQASCTSLPCAALLGSAVASTWQPVQTQQLFFAPGQVLALLSSGPSEPCLRSARSGARLRRRDGN
jgi:hypothetical protein